MQKKPIKDYPNYSVFDDGRILNESTGKFLQGTIRENGYKVFRLSKDGIKKGFFGHRLVAEAFIPNLENKPIVNHKDGNKLNNCVDNLEWVSSSENVQHAYDNELIKKNRKSEYYTEDLEDEKWVKTFLSSRYSVSSYGRVKNDSSNLLLKPSITSGYYKVRLSTGEKVQDIQIYKLVYYSFNPQDMEIKDKVIDHIDANKLNDKLDNLRLVSRSENVLNAYYTTKTNSAIKAVIQMDIKGNYIAEFPSAAAAGRALKLDSSGIAKVCRGVYSSCGGYLFKYKK